MNVNSSNRWQAAARTIFASLFLLGGVAKLVAPAPYREMMQQAGLGPIDLLLPTVAIFEFASGLAIALGWRIGGWAAFALAAHTIAINLLLHRFWAYDGEIRQLELSAFFKNVSIAGALLLYGLVRLRIDE